MKESRIIVTISGDDTVGIVAKFANILAEYKVNIEDIRQTIMQGHFVMCLMGDISNSNASFHDIKETLVVAGKELGMEVWVQRKTIFDKMHTI